MLAISSAPGSSGPGAPQSARARAGFLEPVPTGSQTLCAQSLSPEEGAVTQREGGVCSLRPTCKKRDVQKRDACRLRVVRRLPGVCRRRGRGHGSPHPGGVFALDPIRSAIKVALRVLLSITLLELQHRSLVDLQPPPPLAMDPNCSCASGKGGCRRASTTRVFLLAPSLVTKGPTGCSFRTSSGNPPCSLKTSP